MKSSIKIISLSLILFFSFVLINAQTSNDLPIETLENKGVCGLLSPPLMKLTFSVSDNNNKYLKDFTYKDFEVYEDGELEEIVFFRFDELKNQYVLGIFEENLMDIEKSSGSKIEVKLTKENQKFYGNIFIKELSKIYPDRN